LNDEKKTLFSAAGFGLLSRVITISIRFFSLPLTLSVISKDRYGAWLIILSLVGWLSMSDLGIPSALQNRMIELRAKGMQQRSETILAFGIRLLFFIGIGVAFLFSLLAIFAPLATWLTVAANIGTEVKLALIVCVFSFGLGLPSRVGNVLNNVHGKLHMPPLYELLGTVFSFLMLLLAVYLHWNSILALVCCSLIGLIAGSGLSTVIAFKKFKYSFKAPPATSADRKSLLAKGSFFFLTTIAELLVLQSDAMLIGFVLGAEYVPLFLIPSTLFINFLQIQNIWLRPLWPHLTDLYVKREVKKLKLFLTKTLGYSLLLAICFGLFIIFFGDKFIKMWSHKAVGISTIQMAFGFAFYTLVASVDNIISTFVNAFGKIEARFLFTLFAGVAKFLAGWLVLKLILDGIQWLPLVYGIVIFFTSLIPNTLLLIKTWKSIK
jgi:O-antigen/teichoic acid export membrane protein